MSEWTPIYCRACGGLTNPGMAGADDLCECRSENAPRSAAYQRGFADGRDETLAEVREALERAIACDLDPYGALDAIDAARMVARILGIALEDLDDAVARSVEQHRAYHTTRQHYDAELRDLEADDE